MTSSVNFACHRGPAVDFCYRSVARQRTDENPPVPANHSQTVAVTLRLFRSIVTAPLCHLSSRGSGVNQLSQFSCHPFSLHPARKHTQITALPTVPPPIHTHMQSSDYTRPNQCMRMCSPLLQPLPLPVGLKAFLFDGGVITVEVFVGTDEQPQLRVCVCLSISGCVLNARLAFVYFFWGLVALVVLIACQVHFFSLLPFNLDVMLSQTPDGLGASLKRLLKRALHYFH